MQQIKTLRQNALHKAEMIKEHDAEINALLADGWQILNLTTYIDANCDERIVTLVRYIESKPETKAATWMPKLGETVWRFNPTTHAPVAGKVTELIPKKNGFMVHWLDIELPTFETEKSAAALPE